MAGAAVDVPVGRLAPALLLAGVAVPADEIGFQNFYRATIGGKYYHGCDNDLLHGACPEFQTALRIEREGRDLPSLSVVEPT